MSVNPRTGVEYEGHVAPSPRGPWSLFDEKPVKLEPSQQEIVRRVLRSVSFHRMPETPDYKDLHVAQVFSPSGLEALVLLSSCNSAGSFRDLDDHLARRAPLFLNPSSAIMEGLSLYLDVCPPLVWSTWHGGDHRPLDWPCFGSASALKPVGAVDEFSRWLCEALSSASAGGELDYDLVPSFDEMEKRLRKYFAGYLEDKFEWVSGCFSPTSTLKASPLFWGVETHHKYLFSARAAFLALQPGDPLGKIHSVQRWCGHRLSPSIPLVDLTTEGIEGNPELGGPSSAPVVEPVGAAVPAAVPAGSASASGVAEHGHVAVADAPFQVAAVSAPSLAAAVDASDVVVVGKKAKKNRAQRKRMLAKRRKEAAVVGGGSAASVEAAAVASSSSFSSSAAPPERVASASASAIRGGRGGSKRQAVVVAPGGEMEELRKRLKDKENEVSSLRSAYEGGRGQGSGNRRSGSRLQPRRDDRMDQLIGVVGKFADCVPALVAMAANNSATQVQRPPSPVRSSSFSSRRQSPPRERRGPRAASRGGSFNRGGSFRGQRGGQRPQRRADSRWDQPPPSSSAPALPASPLPLGPPPVVRLPVPLPPSSSSSAPSLASVVVVAPASSAPVPVVVEQMDTSGSPPASSSPSSSRRRSPIRYPAPPRPRSDNVDVRVKDGQCQVIRDNGADD